ncbi:MAG: hypothetical protein ACRDD1_00925 [Planctomycetia bacterium]
MTLWEGPPSTGGGSRGGGFTAAASTLPLPSGVDLRQNLGRRRLRPRPSSVDAVLHPSKDIAMSDVQQAQQRLQQFVQLLPLTMSIAGLPVSEHGKYYNEDQMELRARSIMNAFKHARKIAKEVIQEEK